MISIGFRAESAAVCFAVVTGTSEVPELLDYGKITSPSSYDLPAALAQLRSRVSDLIERHKPDAVGVRFSETFFRNKLSPTTLNGLFARARIEGVLIEAAHAAGVGSVSGGAMQTISSRMGSKRAKAYLETGELRGIDLSKKPESVREAILVATAQLGQ